MIIYVFSKILINLETIFLPVTVLFTFYFNKYGKKYFNNDNNS